MDKSIKSDLPTNTSMINAITTPAPPKALILLFLALSSISRNTTMNSPGNTKSMPRKSTAANKLPNRPPTKVLNTQNT